MAKIGKLTFDKAYHYAVQLWGDLAFVEIVPESNTVNEHKVVGDGKGLLGFGKTWGEAFEDAITKGEKNARRK